MAIDVLNVGSIYLSIYVYFLMFCPLSNSSREIVSYFSKIHILIKEISLPSLEKTVFYEYKIKYP